MAESRAGWTVVAVGCVALALSFAYRNLLQLTMTGMEGELAWSRSMLSSGATVALIAMAAGNLFGGMLVDRYGPRNLVAVGLACLGIGMLGTGLSAARWQYVLAYGAFAGAGFGLASQSVVAAAIARFFVERRGLALGISAAGGPAGQMTLIPLAALLLAGFGWRGLFIVSGIAALVFAPIAYRALRVADRPAQSGPRPGMGADFGYLLKSPVFHLLFWGFFLCGFTTIGVIETHFVPYATLCGFSPVTSANAFGFLSVLNLAGILLAGWLADRMDRILLLAGIYLLRALTFIMLLAITDNTAMLFAFSGLYGLFDYATAPVTASLVASHLGLRVMGFAMGLIAMAHQLGAAAGAIGGGVLFDATRSYNGLWILSLALAVVAAVLSIFIRRQPAPAAA
ncbi:MAG TPA: MFS transporter [Burkholderiales bacterium]|nr:MFS transporter [Burkholderiales bacterium]